MDLSNTAGKNEKKKKKKIPGSPVVRTPGVHCLGPRFNP